MEFSLDSNTLSKPWFRLVIGILLIVLGIVCSMADKWYSGVTRENCTQSDVVLQDVRVELDEDTAEPKVWLIFENYPQTFNIHPSCVSSELTSELLALKNGTTMTIVHSDKNASIYELSVNGKVLLDFDTAKQNIDKNITYVKYAGYAFVPVGAIFIITFIVSAVKKARRNEVV